VSSQTTILIAAIILAVAVAYAGSQLKSSEVSGGMLYSPPQGQQGVFVLNKYGSVRYCTVEAGTVSCSPYQ
jgi:hypothetical protein